MMIGIRKISGAFLFALCSLVYSTDEHIGEYVTLYPPENVTVGYMSDSSAFVYWYPPPVYLHKYPAGTGTIKVTTPAPTKASNNLPTVAYNNHGNHSEPDTAVDVVSHLSENSTQSLVNSTVNGTLVLDCTHPDSSAVTCVQNSSAKIVAGDDKNPVIWTPWKPHYYNGSYVQDIHGSKLVGPNVVSFYKGHLAEYRVTYWTDDTDVTNKDLFPQKTHYEIKNLKPDTEYHVNVSAVYTSAIFIRPVTSKTYTFRTLKGGSKADCKCDQHGTLGDNKTCNIAPGTQWNDWCRCRDEYSGYFCESCKAGYYRNAIGLPCYKCPCSEASSTGSCHFVYEYLHCDLCKMGYHGNLCHICKPGYFRYTNASPCRPCNCHGNADTCKYTGECKNCKHNTTGFSCERCARGYFGDPIHNKNCTHKDDIPAMKRSMNTPLVAGICIAVILVLCAVVGLIVYRKCQHNPASKPFWTVELKDDHEGVNFSNVPEDDSHGHVDDLDFYDGQKNRKGIQKYSPLREEI